MSLKFDLPKDQNAIIKVIGVGGGGGNAVNYMFNMGIKDVDFIICNTDAQQLNISPVPTKVQLGASLTEGRGAGSIPEIGKNAAIENVDELKDILSKDTKMVFITAGMGGGTGTGAAPVIAKLAKDMGILTVGIVTMPFAFEGKKRKEQAEKGLEEIRDSVDTLLIINNERLREMYGNLGINNAFSHADNVLCTAAKGIAEVISITGIINIDFNDVSTVMRDSGVAIMGQATAEGENRARNAVEQALSSPLLNDNDITGARYVLLNITYGDQELLMDEISEITDYIQDEAGSTADVIFGHAHDPALGDKVGVTIIATGFQKKMDTGVVAEIKQQTHVLTAPESSAITKPLENPMDSGVPKAESIEEVSAKPEIYIRKADETEVKKEEPEAKKEEEKQPEFIPPIFTQPVQPEFKSITFEPKEETPEFNTNEGVTATQNSFEFDVKPIFSQSAPELPKTSEIEKTEEKEDITAKTYTLNDKLDEVSDDSQETLPSDRVSKEDLESIKQERFARIRENTVKLRTPSGLSDLENVPAYKRRNISLTEGEHSSESSTGKFSIGKDEDGKTGLRPNNSYLHDNVD
jgi:cell division protein FtsZ